MPLRSFRARCSRRLVRQRLRLPLEVGGTLGDHVARLAVALARVVVALAGSGDGVGLQVAPAAGTARRPQQRGGDADADDDRGNRARIFTRRVVSASVGVRGLIRQVVESLSHLHASYGLTDTRARRVPLSLLRLSLASEERADHAREAALALDDGRGARRVRLVLLGVRRLLRLRAAWVPMLLPRAAGGSAMAALRQLLAFRHHAGAGFAQLVIARRGRRRGRPLLASLPVARLLLVVAAAFAIAAWRRGGVMALALVS